MHGAHAAKSKERSLTKEFGCEKFDGNYETKRGKQHEPENRG